MARNAVDRLEARPEYRRKRALHGVHPEAERTGSGQALPKGPTLSLPEGRDSGDGLPEYTLYRDDGCGGECIRSLECPYPRCRYDDPLLWQRLEREERDREILTIRAAEGLTVDALAARFDISRRTVHRILARARGGTYEEVMV